MMKSAAQHSTRSNRIGFDVSEYRDAEGKYIINAEKIEQMVVGERVTCPHRREDGRQEARSESRSRDRGGVRMKITINAKNINQVVNADHAVVHSPAIQASLPRSPPTHR